MYNRILCPVDGSDPASRGLTEAIRLAKNQSAQLRVLHVLDLIALNQYPPVLPEVYERFSAAAQEILSQAACHARAAGLEPETHCTELTQGTVASHILAEARAWHADLIVMGTHGRRGVERLIAGSDANTVVAGATCPVLLIR